MSRATYLKQLERTVSASQKVIDDLTQENYELKQLLRETAKRQANEPANKLRTSAKHPS
jgi:hypothetical protein